MKLMKYDYIPRKYHFLWNSHNKSITIQVHKDCIQNAKPVPHDLPWLNDMVEQHDVDTLFDSFEGNLKKDSFGFNRLIRKSGESGDYVEYIMFLPQIRKELNRTCTECGGTCKRPESDEQCLWCQGSGKKYIYDWRDAYLTTFNLNFLLNILDMCDETSSLDHQHVTLTVLSQHGQHGSSLGGHFGIEFSEYLRHDTPELRMVLQDAIEAMKIAYGHMMVLRSYDKYSIRGRISENGFLVLDCPGDACGVHMSDHDSTHGYGRQFSCHNVDNAGQALTLITGIASLAGQIGFFLSARGEKVLTC